MKKLKKLLFLLTILTFISCSKNSYVRTIEKGYSKSKIDKTIYFKEDKNFIYTKKQIKYSVYENQHFLVLKEDKQSGEKTLYLALKYRGDEWIYMNGLDLISNKIYHINFMARKLSTALWRDKSNLVDSIEEYIAFALKPEEINEIQSMVNSGNGKIKYYSEIEDREATTTLSLKELENMKDILNLYSNK